VFLVNIEVIIVLSEKEIKTPYKSAFKEMANIGKVDDLVIQVYTDHNPPHFHVVKKDKFEVRLEIDTLNVLSYKWQKNNSKITTKEIKEIEKWLKKSNVKDKDLSNYKAIKFAWMIMND